MGIVSWILLTVIFVGLYLFAEVSWWIFLRLFGIIDKYLHG